MCTYTSYTTSFVSHISCTCSTTNILKSNCCLFNTGMSLYNNVHKWSFLSLYGMIMHTECLALQSSGAQEPPTPIDPTASTISSSVILTATLSNFSAPSTILKFKKKHILYCIVYNTFDRFITHVLVQHQLSFVKWYTLYWYTRYYW